MRRHFHSACIVVLPQLQRFQNRPRNECVHVNFNELCVTDFELNGENDWIHPELNIMHRVQV